MLLLLNFSAKYRRLNHQKCLQFAPLDFCCGVGGKVIHPCTGFCGIMALLIALSYKGGNRLCMSHFFSLKKKCLDYAEIISSLCQLVKIPFLPLRNYAFPISMIELLLIFKSISLFSDYYLTILLYDNNHQITTSEVDLQLH